LLPKINSVEDKLYDVKYKESEAKRILWKESQFFKFISVI
jgi:hypothetical protein